MIQRGKFYQCRNFSITGNFSTQISRSDILFSIADLKKDIQFSSSSVVSSEIELNKREQQLVSLAKAARPQKDLKRRTRNMYCP